MRSSRAATRALSTLRPFCALSCPCRRILRAATARGSNCRSRSRGAGTPAQTISSLGHDSRLAQVVTNLIDNACSFSRARRRRARLAWADARPDRASKGRRPSIALSSRSTMTALKSPAMRSERIFERFYTDRPNQGFGQNSGLGLSISRQIVEAHGGRIWACNRPTEPASVRVAEPQRDDPTNRRGTARVRVLWSNCRRMRHDRRRRAQDGPASTRPP